MTFLDDLNNRQREAAETLFGPLLIVAGAGSGKTRALTYRVANLIAQGAAKPWQILAVTFTNKAAEEMKIRIEELLSAHFSDLDAKNRPMIGTFHSVCARILRSHFNRFKRESSFVIYDTLDQESVMKRILRDLEIRDNRMKPSFFLSAISSAKNRLQSAEDFQALAHRSFDKTAASVYREYERRLTESNALDFDDLLVYTVRLFREHPDVLDYYQERWRFINVDEYQDTNHAQYALTNLLSSKYRNLCVIGDSDQSIYRFRGADIQNILNFERDYPSAKLIKLEQNYRSTQSILDAADAVIEKNKQRKSKKMWTEKKGGDRIDVWHLASDYHEAERVTQEIGRLKQETGVLSKDIAILYRTNAQSRLIEEMLLRYGYPYRVIGGVKFYARREVKDILAYLRVLLNPQDTDSLLRIINVPSRRIGLSTISQLQTFALERSLSLGEVLNHIEMAESISGLTRQRLSSFWKMMMELKKESETQTVSGLISLILRKINYKEYLLDGTEEGEMRYENVLELISVAAKFDHLPPRESLTSFLQEVALVAETDQLSRPEDSLTLMTLHSVKGLEFPYVFIVGCEEYIFPHTRSLFDPEGLEEERRLMYVGITRAMKKLYLTAARQRTLYGNPQQNPLSRFVRDIPKELIHASGLDFTGPSLPDTVVHFSPGDSSVSGPNPSARLTDGDKVKHLKYGEGIVVSSRGDLITVAFTNPLHGIKRFSVHVAPLQKM